jgi:hypothetical protein
VRPLYFFPFLPLPLPLRTPPPSSRPRLPLRTPLSDRARIRDGDALSDREDGRRWTHPCPYRVAGCPLPQHRHLLFPLESPPLQITARNCWPPSTPITSHNRRLPSMTCVISSTTGMTKLSSSFAATPGRHTPWLPSLPLDAGTAPLPHPSMWSTPAPPAVPPLRAYTQVPTPAWLVLHAVAAPGWPSACALHAGAAPGCSSARRSCLFSTVTDAPPAPASLPHPDGGSPAPPPRQIR